MFAQGRSISLFKKNFSLFPEERGERERREREREEKEKAHEAVN